MASINIKYWNEIPMSFTVKEGRGTKIKKSMPAIFSRTINQMAGKMGGISADTYMAGFRTVKEEREGDPEVIAEELLTTLIDQHPREWLLEQSRSAGKE